MRQWIDLYSKDLEDGLTFQLFNNDSGYTTIQADYRLDNESFYFLINYLKYPESIEYTIDVEGFTIGKDDNQLKDKALLVYISPSDEEYDHVLVTTSENENFKVDFGGKITETSEAKIYRLPNNLTYEAIETIVIDKRMNIEKVSEERTDILAKRFIIIAAIIISAYVLAFLIYNQSDNFMKANYTIAFAVWGWLVFDYKILQVDRLYLGSVALALMIFIYGYVLDHEFSDGNKADLVSIGTTMPIFFLLLQRPLRFAFKGIMGREPVVEKPVPSFADFVYFFILWMSTLLIPAYYFAK
ncbi:MAG TPA: hypothetical protein PLV12_02455 [Saprospiraceae bacterium]|nr:hypothetical protein [Saprospiraceae bacterium]